MNKNIVRFLLTSIALATVYSCSNDTVDQCLRLNGDTVAFYDKTVVTRASEAAFDPGDAIGVFAAIGDSGRLKASQNYADNVKYVYATDHFIPFDEGIPVAKGLADSIAYYAVYPYTETAAPEFIFKVNEDQSTYDQYTKSDLCMAAVRESAMKSLVTLQFNHVLTNVTIDASELELSPDGYRIELIAYKGNAKVNLKDQTAIGESGSEAIIKMCPDGEHRFKAILPPQTMELQNVAGRLFIGNLTTSISIYIFNKIELLSGHSVELKLRRKGDVYYLQAVGDSDSSIPSDQEADPNPEVGEPTTTIPNIQYTSEVDGSDVIIRIDMTGVQDPFTLEWLRLFGTRDPGQNIWISVDGQPKGFTVYNNEDDEGDNRIMTDVIFTVDNSGSMNEEAEAVARDIMTWSQTLAQSGLDVRFACVGYSVSGTINGGIDFTDAAGLSTFLNRSMGTNRTMGFGGSNAAALQMAASSYSVYDECGAMAIRYADANLNFRNGANRIYVNFTDEPNQPNGNQDYSVEFFADQSNWMTSKGTVHTVYSGPNFTEQLYWNEWPWKISDYTGGTTFKTDSGFTGVNLNNLPVTGAMQHSYVIRFHNIAHLIDGQVHVIRITILSADGRVRAERTFYVTFTLN